MVTALITGATRGIGRAVAVKLAASGISVAIVGRSDDTAQRVAHTIKEEGGDATSFVCDLAVREDLRELVERVAQRLGAPTVLVHAAASHYQPKKLHHLTDDEIDALIEVDFMSAIHLCRDILPFMVGHRFGRIVMLGSVAAQTGVRGGTLYAAAKAGLEGLVRGIAVDESRFGVTANVVRVGIADTERIAERTAGDEKAKERLVQATAIRRLPSAEEIAELVAFLCSSAGAATTGSVIDATAGAHLNLLW